MRGSILLMNGVLWVFGTEIWGIEGAGAISALLMSFVAAYIWKEERVSDAEIQEEELNI